MNPIIVDAQVLAQLELEQHIKEQAAEIAPEFEIDCVDDSDFGALWRLWSGSKLLGTFYRADADGLWVAQPFNSEQLSVNSYQLNPNSETPRQTVISYQ